MSRVIGAPCGDSTIELIKGADSSANQQVRNDLLCYLKCTKYQKWKIAEEKPDLCNIFEEVWVVRNKNVVPGLPHHEVLHE